MKHLLITCLLLAGSFGLYQTQAQTWDAPSYKGETPVSGTSYYIYNIGANGFLNRGGTWGTHAVISAFPKANASTNTIKWKVTNPASGQIRLEYVNNDAASGTYLFHDGSWDSYGDGGISSGTGSIWLINETDAVNHIVSLQNDLFTGDKYLGWSTYTASTNTGKADEVFTDKGAGTNTQWKFVSQSNYELFQAKVELDRYLRYAQALGGIEISDYITTYNSDVKTDITTASASILAELNRTSVTVPNFSFETSGLSGWTNTGGNNGYQTASSTANVGQGWTKNGNIFAEDWISSGSNLPNGSLVQTITGLTNGIYELRANGHAVQQFNLNSQGRYLNPLHTGVFLKCGSKSIEVSSGKDDYIVDMVTVTNGELTIGHEMISSAINWTGFDNFRLYYYGPTFANNSKLTNITSNTGTLSPAFTTNTTAYELRVPTGTTSIDLTTVKFNESSTVVGDGTVSGLSLPQMVNVTVTSPDGLSETTYSIYVMEDCFSKTYADKTNLVNDPNIISLSNFTGWEWTVGARNLNSNPDNAYCGRFSGSVGAAASGTASLNYAINSNIKANTTYRVRAFIYSTTGIFNLGVYNMNSTVYEAKTTQNNSWEEVNLLFTTGASPNASDCGIYFNNYSTTGRGGYIDNLEMYEIESETINDGNETTLSSDKFSNEYNVEAGSKLTLNSGVNLNVNRLNLNASGDQTATFINKGTSKSINGKVKLNLAKDRLWYISSPVTAATATVLSATDNQVAWYDETQSSGWTSILATATLTPGKGYAVNSSNLDRIPEFTGTLNDGDVAVNLTKTDAVSYSGYNLVGNPYPSFLDIASVVNSNANVEKSIWYRSHNGSNMVFDIVNLTDANASVVNSGRSKVTGVIPPMQAFWLKTAAATTLTFTNAMRSHVGESSTSFKAPASTENQYLKLQVSNGANSDQCLIYFNANALDAKDAYDTYKMSNDNATIPEIYTLIDGQKMVINGLELKDRSIEMPLGFTTGESNTFTLSAVQMTNLGDNVKVYLTDKLMNTTTEITTDQTYSFTSEPVSTADRFTVLFKSASGVTGTEQVALRSNVYVNQNQEIVIESNESIQNGATVSLYNVAGQLVYSQALRKSTETIPTQGKGAYIIRINNQSTNTYKVNIQ